MHTCGARTLRAAFRIVLNALGLRIGVETGFDTARMSGKFYVVFYARTFQKTYARLPQPARCANGTPISKASVHTSVNAARRSACATQFDV